MLRLYGGLYELSSQRAVTHRVAELQRRSELQHQARP